MSLRSLTHLLLILSVLVTAQIIGMARGQARVADQMVICSGGAVLTVQVDADGNPVGAPHFCPDCAMTLLTGLATTQPELQRPISLRSLAWSREASVAAAPQSAVEQTARGPPSCL